MNLHYFDIRADVPDTLRGVYDIVHIRLLSFVLQDDEIERVARNVMQLLKPGGYIQWGEPDVSSFRIETIDSQAAAGCRHPAAHAALTELLHVSQAQDSRLKPTWVPKLPFILESLGLESVESDVKDAPPDVAMATHNCNLAIHELIARKTGNHAVREQLERIIPLAVRESREGAFWAFTRWVVVGRMPRGVR
ncbi:hypothetical protein BDW72DRAFT_182562 [Aspergillus terricola var. indicus]